MAQVFQSGGGDEDAQCTTAPCSSQSFPAQLRPAGKSQQPVVLIILLARPEETGAAENLTISWFLIEQEGDSKLKRLWEQPG